MENSQTYNSRFTADEIENAIAIALSIANHTGLPRGTGNGNLLILGIDTDKLSADGERIPTSAAVCKAIAEARSITKLLTFCGNVQQNADLPIDAARGNVYLVETEGKNYAWDGDSWVSIGSLLERAVESVNGKAGAVELTADDVGALPSSGGTMTGAVDMGGNGIKRLPEPVDDADAARKVDLDNYILKSGGSMSGNLSVPAPTGETHAANKAYVDTAAVHISLPASGWEGDTAPFVQTVTVAGLADGRRVRVYPEYGDDFDTNLAMRDACGCLSYTKRDGQNVTFTCLEDKPAVDINVVLEVYV